MAESEPFLVPTTRARVETKVIDSRFIASLAPTATSEAAHAFVSEIRSEMPDASHHAYAYIIGHGATAEEGLSDDGEPRGTAGRPLLLVLRGSGLSDITVVVTRYFGGTLLGSGGLVHAYSEAVRAGLQVLSTKERI